VHHTHTHAHEVSPQPLTVEARASLEKYPHPQAVGYLRRRSSCPEPFDECAGQTYASLPLQHDWCQELSRSTCAVEGGDEGRGRGYATESPAPYIGISIFPPPPDRRGLLPDPVPFARDALLAAYRVAARVHSNCRVLVGPFGAATPDAFALRLRSRWADGYKLHRGITSSAGTPRGINAHDLHTCAPPSCDACADAMGRSGVGGW
jgi:hypothetical protein